MLKVTEAFLESVADVQHSLKKMAMKQGVVEAQLESLVNKHMETQSACMEAMLKSVGELRLELSAIAARPPCSVSVHDGADEGHADEPGAPC